MTNALFEVKRSFICFVSASIDGDQTEKSPSDEGFTELDAEVTSMMLTSDEDQKELVAATSSNQENTTDPTALRQTEEKRNEEDDDEGVAQNCSVEDADFTQSLLETSKLSDAKNCKSVTGVKSNTTTDQKTVPAREDVTRIQDEACPDSLERTEGLAGGNELSEEEKRKKCYEAEVKSWLLQRMQAPIEGALGKPLIPQSLNCSLFF